MKLSKLHHCKAAHRSSCWKKQDQPEDQEAYPPLKDGLEYTAPNQKTWFLRELVRLLERKRGELCTAMSCSASLLRDELDKLIPQC